MNLWQTFVENTGRPIHKWHHYFPIYERHFSPWRNKTLTFIEIGVFKGGSLEMWSRFFGPMATVIGIDINPECKRYESDNIHVRIGDQSDCSFLDSVMDEFGLPDIVLDDGSHRMEHIAASFHHLYPRLSKNGLYMVEDLHTAYWKKFGGGINNPESFINLCKGFIDKLNAHHAGNQLKPDFFTNNTYSMSFYDSIVVFERGSLPKRMDSIRGCENDQDL